MNKETQEIRRATVKEGYKLQPGKTYRCPPQGDVTRHEFITCPYRSYELGVVRCLIDSADGACYAWEDIEIRRREKEEKTIKIKPKRKGKKTKEEPYIVIDIT